jgi:hypothetical protein
MTNLRTGAAGLSPRVHLLDVGAEEYGDSILCRFGDVSVLIDGAHPGDQVGTTNHPSIPDQLSDLLGQDDPPYRVDLLIVTHTHQDHIGCLPFLVHNDLLIADWALVADPGLGWGRADGDGQPAVPDARVQALVAGLREEIRTSATDDRMLARFLVDAVNLETQYLAMLQALEAKGTRLVRYGRDVQGTAELITTFQPIGLEILGPSQAQLLICAEAIARTTNDSTNLAFDLLDRRADASAVSAYRALVSARALDSIDASSRPGSAINLQSVVASFAFEGAKVLFTGDMQFADPQRADPGLEHELLALRQRIAASAPFDMVKIGHHGSENAFSREVMQELGSTRYFGMCAGEESLAHPSREVLELLDGRPDDVRWARTDRNGLSTFYFGRTQTQMRVSRGEPSDPDPNAPDETAALTPSPSGAPEAIPSTAPTAPLTGQAMTAGPDEVRVDLRLPEGPSRFIVTLDVGEAAPVPRPSGAFGSDVQELMIGGGRQLPDLLFVTNAPALRTNMGAQEADLLLEAIPAQGHRLLDDVPCAAGSGDAAAAVRARLREAPEIEGVVIVGGYDVVPSERLDVLPAALRQHLGVTNDPDDFVVWSDDAYGDLDDDGERPELPVSRIPDGHLADLVFTAIQAPSSDRVSRKGVRNVARPFASSIYQRLPGPERLLVSQPQTYDAEPALKLDADCVYLMLHGDHADSSRFWGEETPNDIEAVNISNVPVRAGSVVFTGCCWGALIVDPPAVRVGPGVMPGPKAPGSSIALSFLQAGANAFVGCTGAHYSPAVEPFGYFGAPLHGSFWSSFLGGRGPSEALLDAKRSYVRAMPHGQTGATAQAIEFKILHQYTCLGLGW